ncbi:MAG: DEAD/DEAH box helicase [Candidatus Diapherotrites archaeon]|nr:DEAD/DEAH box helicase [Candidatus Diapherotrites archaeon]
MSLNMNDFISHPLILPNTVEARLYQQVLVARILEQGNSLVVAPTALGKTIVGVLLSAHVLHKNADGKVLFLSPSKPLAVQHLQSLKKFLAVKEEQISLLTGEISPRERESIWENSL